MKITNVDVFGMEKALIACQYPMSTDVENLEPNFDLLCRLGKAKVGSGHDCALKSITVQADLTCSQAMHMQFLRYHFVDIVSSQSKMHRLVKMDIRKQCNEYVCEDAISLMEFLVHRYNLLITKNEPQGRIKEAYLDIIYNCPMGLELTFRFTTNYLQLKTLVMQRYTHRLPEWKLFVKWALELPHFKELTGVEIDLPDHLSHQEKVWKIEDAFDGFIREHLCCDLKEVTGNE